MRYPTRLAQPRHDGHVREGLSGPGAPNIMGGAAAPLNPAGHVQHWLARLVPPPYGRAI